ncbi:hypothetical protein [Pedobacter ureilyticus]|uniref:Lipoprotein n=1 Tax=Pedobacter ureilyticus TaxID=1393051 RepID=A0ABW9J6X6_9SPHI|nr:hypothetical protein [Pedobacter helvus]
MERLVYLTLILSSFYFSCRNIEKSKENIHQIYGDRSARITRARENKIEKTKNNLDSTKSLIRQRNTKDTSSYTFILEGNFSAEGNEGKAFYRGNKINKIKITFYGETGKIVYNYRFRGKLVDVSQQRFHYRTDFTEVKSAKDITNGEQINFITDLEGNLVKGINKGADLDTFHELKKAIPFDLI